MNVNDIIIGLNKLLSRLIGEEIEFSTFNRKKADCGGRHNSDRAGADEPRTNARDAMPHGGVWS